MRTYRLGFGLVAVLACLSTEAAADGTATSPCKVTIDKDAQSRDRMTILGTLAKQTIFIVANADGTIRTFVDCNGDGDYADAVDLPGTTYAPASSFYTIDVQGKGADTVILNLEDSATYSGLALNPHVTLGPGTNYVTLFTRDAELTTKSHLLIDVVGGAGNDWVEIYQPALTDSIVSVNAALGAGNDTFRAHLAGTASGGTFEVNADLGAGTNSFTVDRIGGLVAAPPTFRANVIGGAGVDVVSALLKEAYPAPFSLTANLGAGNDQFLASLNLANLQVDDAVLFDVNGGDGTNLFRIDRSGTTYTDSQRVGGTLEFRLKGGLGIDTLNIDLGQGGLDLHGTGTYRLRADLGAGNDVVRHVMTVSELPAAPDGTTIDISLTGGAGNDRITQTFNNNGHNLPANYGPLGAVMIDGGSGVDTCFLAGTGLSHGRNCEL